MHVSRKLRDDLRSRKPTVSRERSRSRRQILRVTGIATTDANEVVALLLEQRRCRLYRFGDRTDPSATFRNRGHAEQLPSSADTPSSRATSLSPRFAASIRAVSSSPLASWFGAFCQKHFHGRRRHRVRSGSIQQWRIAAYILHVDVFRPRSRRSFTVSSFTASRGIGRGQSHSASF